MLHTALVADPAVRLAGARKRTPVCRRRYVAAAPERRRPRIRPRWALVAALLLLVAGALGYLQTWPPLATVMSASMEPTIKTGDVVVLRKLDGPAQVGDVVSIGVPDAARARFGYPPVVIHRIVAISAAGTVSTQGDAHKAPDPFTIPRTALTTEVVVTIPAAGRALGFLGSGLGLLWLAGGVALLLGLPLLDRSREAQAREHGEREGLHTALGAVTAELSALRDEGAASDERLRELTATFADRAETARRETEDVHARAQAAEREAAAQRIRAEFAERDAAATEQRLLELTVKLGDRAEEARLSDELLRARADAAERDAAATEQRLLDLTVRIADRAHEAAAAEAALRGRAEAAERVTASAEAQLRVVAAAFSSHLDELPARIAREVALAFAAQTPPPPPPAPSAPAGLVAASRWTPAPAGWDAAPAAVAEQRLARLAEVNT